MRNKYQALFFSLLFSIIIQSACNKADKHEHPILAGRIDGNIYYYDFKPDHFLAPIYVNFAGQPTYIGMEELYFDLDNDKINDIGLHPSDGITALPFGSFYAQDTTLPGTQHPTKGTMLTLLHSGISCSPDPFYKNDNLDKNLNWTSMNYKYSVISYLLTSYTPATQNYPAIEYSPWNGTDRYLAIKMVKGKETYYGWIGLQVENYDSVIVRNYAMTQSSF